MHNPDTQTSAYAERLVRLQTAWWKRALHVQAPYAWKIRRLAPGRTLDIGCGIGRCLQHLSKDSVGIDNNRDCVAAARSFGLLAFEPQEFSRSPLSETQFDNILSAHVAEHLGVQGTVELLKPYLPFLKLGGKVILITPQEKGYCSDPTHVEFIDPPKLSCIGESLGVNETYIASFPFPDWVGRYFTYNEFIYVGTKMV